MEKTFKTGKTHLYERNSKVAPQQDKSLLCIVIANLVNSTKSLRMYPT